MRCSWLLPLTGLSSIILSFSIQAQSGPGPYYCLTRDFTKRVAYVSPVFDVKAADAMKVNPAWHQIMKSKYGITALPYQSCFGPFPNVASADSQRTKGVDRLKNSLKVPVTALGWTYAGAPALKVVAQATPAAATTASSTSSAAAPAGITAADRAQFLAEVPKSKGYCEQNYREIYDCDAFAQAVLEHRLAHPEEVVRYKADPTPHRPPVHNLVLGVQYHLDCSRCADDQRLMSYARNRIKANMSQLVMTGMVTQSKVDSYSECVARGFPPQVHKNANVDHIQAAMNDAMVGCGNPNQ